MNCFKNRKERHGKQLWIHIFGRCAVNRQSIHQYMTFKQGYHCRTKKAEMENNKDVFDKYLSTAISENSSASLGESGATTQ